MNRTELARWTGLCVLTAGVLACSDGETAKTPAQSSPATAPVQSTELQPSPAPPGVGSSEQSEAAPALLKLYPASVKAGAAFNKQPDGQNALAVDATNATPSTVLVFDDQSLVTTFGSEKFLSALVPAGLTATPGKHQIRMVDGIRESNRLELVVK